MKMHYFNRKIQYLLGISLMLILSIPFVYADDRKSKVSAEAVFLYHNKYISEGKDELPGSGIWTAEFVINFEELHIGDASLKDFYIGSWWAVGDSENYTETNLFIGKVFEWENFSLDLSYTWLNFSPDDEDDHELVAAASSDCIPWLTPEIAYVYSTETDRGMLELGLSKDIEMESFSITPYTVTAIDFGYVTEEYDGLNHIEVGLEWSLPLNDVISLQGYASHVFAQENLRREGYDNETSAGIGLQFDI